MSKTKKRRSLRTKMMGINIVITFASLVLCGFIFVMAVYLMVGKYVKHDLDFLLTEVSGNLKTKLEYLENVIYDIRNSQEIMTYISEPFKEADTEAMEAAFKKTVDISYAGNQEEGGVPVVEKIYLFSKNGHFLSDSYYAMISSEIIESNKMFEMVWNNCRKEWGNTKGFRDYCFVNGERVYLAFPILDDTMEQNGIIIFELNMKTIQNIMNEMESYEKAFWIFYNDKGVIHSYQAENALDSRADFQQSVNQSPYITKILENDYRVYNKKLCLNLQLTLGIPEHQTMVVLYDSSRIYMVGIILILVVGVVSFGMFTYKITKPMEEVTERIKLVQEGDYETKLPDYDNKEFHEISRVFNQMTDHINYLINQVYEKQISVKEMELKFLQTQMNPHFMFNVLNALALQAKIDGNEEICKKISTFSQLIQAKIYRSDSEKVKIFQEIEYVKYYLEIQKFRYGEKLSYSIQVQNEEVLNLYIPKLCIQMIAENAVVHGLEPKTSEGNVNIVIDGKDNCVLIEIEDDGIGFEQEGILTLPLQTETANRDHNHVGLNNVHHIIQLMYGKEYDITIISHKNQGTKVSIRLPYDTVN